MLVAPYRNADADGGAVLGKLSAVLLNSGRPDRCRSCWSPMPTTA